jgi:hypothetical protein
MKWGSRWSDYAFLLSVSTTEYLNKLSCNNYGKYNSNREKKNHWLLSKKHSKSENSCQNVFCFKTILLVKEIHKIGYIQYVECYTAHIIQEIVQKKATIFYTWLPLSYCQSIGCVMFISFNVIDLMQCNSIYFWSSYHILQKTVFFNKSFFYFLEMIKSTASVFKEEILNASP